MKRREGRLEARHDRWRSVRSLARQRALLAIIGWLTSALALAAPPEGVDGKTSPDPSSTTAASTRLDGSRPTSRADAMAGVASQTMTRTTAETTVQPAEQLTTQPTAQIQTTVQTTAQTSAQTSAKRLDLSPAVFKSAIAAADADWAPSNSGSQAFGISPSPSSPQTKIDRSFQAAEIESCGSNTLKFEHLPVWGDFTIGGLFALPYALHAMATGRCKF